MIMQLKTKINQNLGHPDKSLKSFINQVILLFRIEKSMLASTKTCNVTSNAMASRSRQSVQLAGSQNSEPNGKGAKDDVSTENTLAEKETVVSEASSEACAASNSSQDTPTVRIRDFGYPESSPLHRGQRPVEEKLERRASQISLSSSEFPGCNAQALYDFEPETDREVGMKAGDIVWVQYRQCQGWLVADVKGETGLIPESYVEFIHDTDL